MAKRHNKRKERKKAVLDMVREGEDEMRDLVFLFGCF